MPPDLGGAPAGGGLEPPPGLDLGDLALPPDMGGGGGGLAPPPGLDLGDLDAPAPSAPKPKGKPSPPKGRAGKARNDDDEGGADFGLVISGLGLKSKKEAAIKVIMEIRGMSEDEARDLCRQPVVPVLKRVTKPEAESAMAKFKAKKINCRINKRRGRRKKKKKR